MIVIIWEEGTKGNYSEDRNRLVRQVVQRLLVAVNRNWSSNSTYYGLSKKSSLDLGMCISSTVGQNGHKIPPKP